MAPKLNSIENQRQVDDLALKVNNLSLHAIDIKYKIADRLIQFIKNSDCYDSFSKTARKSRRRPVGVENLSNTCYASAIFQSLYYTPGFAALALFVVDLVRKDSSLSNNLEKDFETLYQIGIFFDKLDKTENRDSAVRPDAILWCMKSFFNGEKDLEKPRIELNQGGNRKNNKRNKKQVDKLGAESEEDDGDSKELLVEVIGPQQDAQEFLTCLLSQLHEEQAKIFQDQLKAAEESLGTSDSAWEEVSGFRSTRSKKKNPKVQNVGGETDHMETCISHLFQGKIRNTFKTQEESAGSNPFFTLLVDVEGYLTLPEALENYFKTEDIFNGDKKVGTTFARFEHLPKVLIIHLKRFAFNFNTGAAYKVRSKMEIPQKLQIDTKFLSTKLSQRRDGDSSLSYELYSVVCHDGRSLNSGHYVNYSFDPVEDGWFYLNDDFVERVGDFDKQIKCNENAYLLFYSLV